jgi:hypothetical protein
LITRRLLLWLNALFVPKEATKQARAWAVHNKREVTEAIGAITLAIALALVDLRLGLMGFAVMLILAANFAGDSGDDDGSDTQ